MPALIARKPREFRAQLLGTVIGGNAAKLARQGEQHARIGDLLIVAELRGGIIEQFETAELRLAVPRA